jgi:hypothetical protein
MGIRIKVVVSAKDYQDFVELPFRLYKNNPYWVPPIKQDELKSLKPETNPAYGFCDIKLWLAEDNGKIVGRIAAIINNSYNKLKGIKAGRFSRFECINDFNAASALFKTAEDWISSMKMEMVHGPLGFSNLDTQGLLIEGFEYIQAIGSVYHMEYYHDFIKQLGYKKESDWVEFRLTVGEKSLDKASRVAKIAKSRFGIDIISFRNKKQLRPYARKIFEILNNSFSELPYVTPFNDEMIDFYADKYIKFLNPEFVKMVCVEDKIIGFVVGLPSLSKAMQKANGKLLPFGLMHILKARKGKGVDTMEQLLTAVDNEYQSTGAIALLMSELQNSMLQKGLKYIETTGVFETNQKALLNWKNFEYIQHKRRRCFKKLL